jgi:hypothetical protein
MKANTAPVAYTDEFCGLNPRIWINLSRPTKNDRPFRLVVRDSGFDSRLYRIFWEVVSLERGPHILVRITEELLRFGSR